MMRKNSSFMNLKKRKLGKNPIKINPIGLGSMYLAIQGRPSEARAIQIIRKSIDAGIELIDTADAYCLDEKDMGYCERLIAKALKNWQGTKPIIASKGGVTRFKGNWGQNGDPKYLKAACEASLKALNVDCIDLYQLHAPDRDVPFLDSMAAFAELRKAGKIKFVGLSNVSVEQIKEAQKIVEITSIQNLCNPYNVEPFKTGLIEYCEQEGLTFFPYSPMGGSSQKHLTPKHPILLKIAKEYQITPYQVILAWLLAKSPIIIPIPGASRLRSVLDSAAAMKIELSNDDLVDLDNSFLDF
jgi:aryl-alcohol dehydrogenase-like predicted oxidoreductase